MNFYVILSPRGYFHDYVRGRVILCEKLENAAHFRAKDALYVQKHAGMPGCAILSTDGKLLELREVL